MSRTCCICALLVITKMSFFLHFFRLIKHQQQQKQQKMKEQKCNVVETCWSQHHYHFLPLIDILRAFSQAAAKYAGGNIIFFISRRPFSLRFISFFRFQTTWNPLDENYTHQKIDRYYSDSMRNSVKVRRSGKKVLLRSFSVLRKTWFGTHYLVSMNF